MNLMLSRLFVNLHDLPSQHKMKHSSLLSSAQALITQNCFYNIMNVVRVKDEKWWFCSYAREGIKIWFCLEFSNINFTFFELLFRLLPFTEFNLFIKFVEINFMRYFSLLCAGRGRIRFEVSLRLGNASILMPTTSDGKRKLNSHSTALLEKYVSSNLLTTIISVRTCSLKESASGGTEIYLTCKKEDQQNLINELWLEGLCVMVVWDTRDDLSTEWEG